MCLYAMLKWITLWRPRLLNYTIRTYMQTVHDWGISFPSLLPALWASLPGREPSGSGEGDWHDSECIMPGGGGSLTHTVYMYTHIYIYIYIYMYMCSGDIILYGTIVIVCVWRAGIHLQHAGSFRTPPSYMFWSFQLWRVNSTCMELRN